MKIEKFLTHIERLDNIRQWEERDSIIKESVSQHSFKVAAICAYLLKDIHCYLCERNYLSDSNLNRQLTLSTFSYDAMRQAVLHDFDEAILGRDISHVVKYNEYNGEAFRSVIDSYVEHIADKNFKEVMPDVSISVRRFVKLCDWIALATFIARNKRLGCYSFAKEEIYCNENILKSIDTVVDTLTNYFGVPFSAEHFQEVLMEKTEESEQQRSNCNPGFMLF